jgi:hypothetical protein
MSAVNPHVLDLQFLVSVIFGYPIHVILGRNSPVLNNPWGCMRGVTKARPIIQIFIWDFGVSSPHALGTRQSHHPAPCAFLERPLPCGRFALTCASVFRSGATERKHGVAWQLERWVNQPSSCPFGNMNICYSSASSACLLVTGNEGQGMLRPCWKWRLAKAFGLSDDNSHRALYCQLARVLNLFLKKEKTRLFAR